MKLLIITVLSLVAVFHTGSAVPVQKPPNEHERSQQSSAGGRPVDEPEEPAPVPSVVQDDEVTNKEDGPSFADLPDEYAPLQSLASADMDGPNADVIFRTIINLFKDDPALLEGLILEMKNEEKELQRVYDQVTKDALSTDQKQDAAKRNYNYQTSGQGDNEYEELQKERQRMMKQFHSIYVPTDEDKEGKQIYSPVAYQPEPMPDHQIVPPSEERKPDYVEEIVSEDSDHKLSDSELEDDDNETQEGGVLYDSNKTGSGSRQVQRTVTRNLKRKLHGPDTVVSQLSKLHKQKSRK